MVRAHPPRVLIVDDDAVVGRSLARLLEADATVVVANSSTEALAKIERGETFDVVVCDVMMPGMTGPQLFDRVKAFDARAAAAFVFMTGGASREAASRVAATGRPCLTKPLDMDALRQLLKD